MPNSRTMKYIAPVLLSAILIYSCANDDAKTDQADKKPYSADSIKQVFTPVIEGTWLNDGYYHAIVETKSPYKAYEKVGFYTGLVVDKQWADSVSVNANLGNHEGTNFIAYYRPGLTANALPTDLKSPDEMVAFTELGYELNDKDTSLVLYFYNSNNAVYNQVKFRKIYPNSSVKDIAFGVEYTINNLLTGKFTYTDKAGQFKTVEFTRNGKVTGFENMNTYSISYDFGDDGYAGDRINFGSDVEPALFGFEYDGNTLNLYTLDLGENGEWSRGKLAYRLNRTNN